MKMVYKKLRLCFLITVMPAVIIAVACGNHNSPTVTDASAVETSIQDTRPTASDVGGPALFPSVGDSVMVRGYETGVWLSWSCCEVTERRPGGFHLGVPCSVWVIEDGTFWVASCLSGQEAIR